MDSDVLSNQNNTLSSSDSIQQVYLPVSLPMAIPPL